MGMETCGEKVMVLCYWNGCVKYGPDGVYYEGSSTPKKISVKRNTKLNRLLDGIYLITGLDKQKSKLKIFGRYPSVSQQSMVKYLLLPVVDDVSLETMLELPRNHPSINSVELYLEMMSTSGDVVVVSSSSKRQRIQEIADYSKPRIMTSLWVEDDHDLRVGLCFKDRYELKKAVDWCSFRWKQKFIARDMYTFECIRSKCNWFLQADRIEEHGVIEITKYNGPHTCSPIVPSKFDVEFPAEEIESLIRKQPTLTISELQSLWFEKYGYELETKEMRAAKQEVIEKIYGDWDESFRELPKFMSALHSSNGVLVDWQYDFFPNTEFASFRGVFWVFPQSVEGFQHCRPLIAVDTKDLIGKYPLKLMIASGLDAHGLFFPLAFAVTKEVSVDSWRWFFGNIREKVTQRKGLCLMSNPHPDILAVINEPGSQWQEPWAYHMFCLNHLCSQFYDVFKKNYLKTLVEFAGSESEKDEFDSYMKTIKNENLEARKWLDKFPPHQWALAHDIGHRRYGIMTIDTIFESFRSLDLPQPVTATTLLLFDALRLFFHTGHSDSSRRLNRGDIYTKYFMTTTQMSTTTASYVVMPLDKDVFQVAWPSEKKEWITQLSERTCTCGRFQTDKYPCVHALVICKKLKINPLQYVDDWYTIERYYKTYSAKFNPVPEVSAWPEAFGVPTLFPPVSDKTNEEIPGDEEEGEEED